VQFGNLEIDFTGVAAGEVRRSARGVSGCRIDDLAAIRAKAKELQIESAGLDDAVLVNEVFEATVEHHLVAPTFVIDYPAAICPLTKRSKEDPRYAERFELFIAGTELANAYTELNDRPCSTKTSGISFAARKSPSPRWTWTS